MSGYIGKKEAEVQDRYANLIKSVYESSLASDNKTVSGLVNEIKSHLLEIMK